jgi:hypothetical protein
MIDLNISNKNQAFILRDIPIKFYKSQRSKNIQITHTITLLEHSKYIHDRRKISLSVSEW